MTQDEIVGWHHRLNGHEFEQTLGDGEGHGSLGCCSLWGNKELDTTEQLNNNIYIRGASQVVLVVRNSPAKAGDVSLIPGLGRSPWSRKWQPTLVFSPGTSHGQRSLVGYSPWGCKSRTRLSESTNVL